MILVIGTSADNLNSNSHIRQYISEGFRELSPDASVVSMSSEDFVGVKTLPHKSLCLFVGSVVELKFGVEIQLERARRLGSRTAVWLHDDPYEFDASMRVLEGADVIFTNDKAALYHYPDRSRVVHLPLASSSRFLSPPISRTGADYLFAGVPFRNRLRFFTEFSEVMSQRKASLKGMLIGPSWELSVFPDAIDRRLSPTALSNLYKFCLSTIYLGRELDLCNSRYMIRASTPGPRLFECAGAGGCQIAMTPGLEITEYLEPSEEMFLVESAEEAVELAIELKKNIRRSLSVGRNAQARVKSEHLYRHRAKTILTTMNSI